MRSGLTQGFARISFLEGFLGLWMEEVRGEKCDQIACGAMRGSERESVITEIRAELLCLYDVDGRLFWRWPANGFYLAEAVGT